jgi:tetratricopeptide (TPR) repeat protein
MNTNTDGKMTYLLLAGALAVLLAGCGQPGQDATQESSDSAAAKIPVTTTSDEARELYMQGLNLSDDLHLADANDVFQQAVAVDDSFAMGHYMAALTAQSNAEFFVSIGKANERAMNASEGEQLLIAALVAGSENDQVAQREALEQVMGLYPKDERTHIALANFLSGVEDFEGAVTHFGHAVAIAPDFASAQNSLGYAYRNLEDFDGARGAFERYVELIPNEANPYDSLAELLMEMGNYDESIENYRKALTINQYFSASYAGITINHSLKGEADLAQEAADQMLASARNFGERQAAMLRSVTSNLFAGNIEAAMHTCDTMLAEAEVKGNHSAMGGVAEYMGDIRMASGDAAKAEELYDAALDYRLRASINEANKTRAARTHLFKTAIAAMVGGDSEAAASRTAEYLAAVDAAGTAFEKLRAHELSGFLAMHNEELDAAAAHFDSASQLNPIVLYWSAVVNRDLGHTDKARDLAGRAANRNTLSANMPFFRSAAVDLNMALSPE